MLVASCSHMKSNEHASMEEVRLTGARVETVFAGMTVIPEGHVLALCMHVCGDVSLIQKH
jgi:hypothetical protein